MGQVDRFSVSLDTELLAAFDRYIAAKGYDNRSEAVRDLIRDLLFSGRSEDSDAEVAAVFTALCAHRSGNVAERMRRRLADRQGHFVSMLSIPMDADCDVVVVVLRGPLGRVRACAGEIEALRGISNGHLSIVRSAPAPG